MTMMTMIAIRMVTKVTCKYETKEFTRHYRLSAINYINCVTMVSDTVL